MLHRVKPYIRVTVSADMNVSEQYGSTALKGNQRIG